MGRTPKSRKKTDSSPDQAQDQLKLFAGAAPRRAEPPPPRTGDDTADLKRLVPAIARASGLPFAEVNYRLNRKIGVRSRAGADNDVIRRAAEAAREWFTQLNTLQSEDATPSPVKSGSVRSRKPTALPTPSAGPPPTPEQQAAIEAFRSGFHMALQAGAGTGKTTALTMLARSDRRRGQYIAFNKPIALDAATKFPAHVSCRTAHSLAREAVGWRFARRLNAPREPAWKAGIELGITINMQLRLGERKVTHKALSYIVFRTVLRFCYSCDSDIRPHHVPRLRGLEAEDLHGQLVIVVLPYARRAWKDLQNEEGVVRFEHDHYLKMWALQEPKIQADYVLLDEAQDTNPCVEGIFTSQRSHAQLVMVGDSAQAIYGWRGARDVMTDFNGKQLSLSQSFRFGPAVAQEANRWLEIIEAPIRLQGSPHINSEIGPVASPDAILCRSNAGAISEILTLLDEGRRVALVGGGTALEKLALAAADLKAGRRPSHPELVLFQTWGELQEYATHDPAGQDLLPLVNVIDGYGVDVVLDAVNRLHSEIEADVTISTAHKAKGREWSTVRIAYDFEPDASPDEDEDGSPIAREIDPEEARLAYVAVTRARQRLDLGGLSWIADHPSIQPREPNPARPHLTLVPNPTPVTTMPPDNPWAQLGPVSPGTSPA